MEIKERIAIWFERLKTLFKLANRCIIAVLAYGGIFFITAVTVGYAGYIYKKTAPHGPLVDVPLEKFAHVGDSFGLITSVFTMLAAWVAIWVFRQHQIDMDKARGIMEEQNEIAQSQNQSAISQVQISQSQNDTARSQLEISRTQIATAERQLTLDEQMTQLTLLQNELAVSQAKIDRAALMPSLFIRRSAVIWMRKKRTEDVMIERFKNVVPVPEDAPYLVIEINTQSDGERNFLNPIAWFDFHFEGNQVLDGSMRYFSVNDRHFWGAKIINKEEFLRAASTNHNVCLVLAHKDTSTMTILHQFSISLGYLDDLDAPDERSVDVNATHLEAFKHSHRFLFKESEEKEAESRLGCFNLLGIEY